MGKAVTIYMLLANLVLLNCQGQNIFKQDSIYNASTITDNPSYSFSYGVSDSHTGDIKTVWEAKEGDTVKGHYSVIEPDGSMRTVEYSAGPDTGFQATVNNEAVQTEVQGRSMVHSLENKAMKDYDHVFDFSEDADEEDHYPRKYKKREHLSDRFRDYPSRKRPTYPIDQETSAYTHTYSIKHPYHDEATADSESYSHFGMSTDTNCKKKKKNENNLYTSVADLDMAKQKYPAYLSNSFKEELENFEPQPTYDFEKISPYKYTKGKIEDVSSKQPTKYSFPSMPDMSVPDKFYSDDLPSRPKKKYKPYKKPEYPIPSDDQDDYILVPKKIYKNPTRFAEPNEFQSEMDDEYRPIFNDDHDEDRFQRPIRGPGQKEIIRKVVKKKKPVINLLEIFDI